MKKIKCPHCKHKLELSKCRSHVKEAISKLSIEIQEVWDEEMEAADALDENLRLKSEDEEYLAMVSSRLESSNPEIAKEAKKSAEALEHRISSYESNIAMWQSEDKRLTKKRQQLETEQRKLMAWNA